MDANKALRPDDDARATRAEDPSESRAGVGKRTLVDGSTGAPYAAGARAAPGAGALSGDNFIQISRCGTLLGALHQIQHAPTEAEIDRQRSAIAERFAGTPLAGDRLRFLLINFRLVVLGEDEHALAYFIGNLSWAPDAIGNDGYRSVLALAQQVWERHQLFAVLAGDRPNPERSRAPAKRRERPEAERPPAKVPTPKLDAAIDAIEVAAKLPLPGAVKEPLETLKSSLELARTAERHGESATYARHIAALGAGVLKTVGELVKAVGANPELAAQACEQLSKLGGILGKAAKGLGALENLSKAIRGKTLAGTPVEPGERYDAAIELVALAAGTTVGAAITISKTEYVWLFNHIGVPIKQATEQAGLAKLFAGEPPEQLKARIDAMPTDAQHALATIRTLQTGTFKPVQSLFSPMIVSDAWAAFWRHRLASSAQQLQLLADTARDRPGENLMTDALRTSIAETYKAAAIAFVDKQVRDAASWDR
jgi:hypothetical protein